MLCVLPHEFTYDKKNCDDYFTIIIMNFHLTLINFNIQSWNHVSDL